MQHIIEYYLRHSSKSFPRILICFLHFVRLFSAKLALKASKRHLSSGKKKAHKHKLFSPIVLGTGPGMFRDNPGLSLGQTHFVPGITQFFSFLYAMEAQFVPGTNPVCSRDKLAMSLRQSRGRRAAEKVDLLKVYVLFRSL